MYKRPCFYIDARCVVTYRRPPGFFACSAHRLGRLIPARAPLLIFFRSVLLSLAFLCLCLSAPGLALARGGPQGIDTRLNRDEQGIWRRSNRLAVEYLTVGSVLDGALWKGSEIRLGKTFWRATDSILLEQAGYLMLNNTFRRQRPSATDDPNQWFKSGGQSFPSGEVTAISSALTPFVLEYGEWRAPGCLRTGVAAAL
jgi:hypothetical protein